MQTEKEALQKAVGDAVDDFHYRAACYDAMKSRGIADPEGFMREVKELTEKWAAYDDLLQRISTPDGNLYSGQLATVDKAYDECVAATRAILTQMEGKD